MIDLGRDAVLSAPVTAWGRAELRLHGPEASHGKTGGRMTYELLYLAQLLVKASTAFGVLKACCWALTFLAGFCFWWVGAQKEMAE